MTPQEAKAAGYHVTTPARFHQCKEAAESLITQATVRLTQIEKSVKMKIAASPANEDVRAAAYGTAAGRILQATNLFSQVHLKLEEMAKSIAHGDPKAMVVITHPAQIDPELLETAIDRIVERLKTEMIEIINGINAVE